jgi:hypothetical protein
MSRQNEYNITQILSIKEDKAYLLTYSAGKRENTQITYH